MFGPGGGPSITAEDVVGFLEDFLEKYGIPEHIRSDNGPEYIAHKVRGFLAKNGTRA